MRVPGGKRQFRGKIQKIRKERRCRDKRERVEGKGARKGGFRERLVPYSLGHPGKSAKRVKKRK